tara:strand:- start:339 stop:515 length:177 start_codon:yes stop_codon:yes gene_type:complete
MDKKFQQVTIIISSDDFGGGSPIPPFDILCDLISHSDDIDLISTRDIKDMHLTIEEVD